MDDRDHSDDRFDNAGSDPDSNLRRTGGSANDPHGGHEHPGHERRAPDPDPIDEMVPGGQGAEPPPYTRSEIDGRMNRVGTRQEGFGGDNPPELTGDADLAPDASTGAPLFDPGTPAARDREGMMQQGDTRDLAGPGHMITPAEETESLAYTATQRPNLPRSGEQQPAFAQSQSQGWSDSQQPVEPVDNALVEEDDHDNVKVADTGIKSGLPPQRHQH